SKAISLPKPSFPPVARFGRATGKVTVAIMIDGNGDVAKIVSVSGNPLLQAAAADAARRAKFSPTTKGGVPLQVTGTIVYNFNR
ncbi:MAG: TonB family protein, partial [Pyrinomonadaceae bacterium]